MLAEIDGFVKWIRRRNPHASTYLHYTRDLALFFAWFAKPPDQVTPRDIDRYMEQCQGRGHCMAAVSGTGEELLDRETHERKRNSRKKNNRLIFFREFRSFRGRRSRSKHYSRSQRIPCSKPAPPGSAAWQKL
jgi:hypothetical protein